MKNVGKFIVFVLIFCMSHNAYADLSQCDSTSFSFADLKYYEKKELISGYCLCKSLVDINKQIQNINLDDKSRALEVYGDQSRQYLTAEKEMEIYSNKINTADGNASRILRFLKKEYKYKDIPKCESTSKKAR